MLGAIIGDIVGSRFEWDNIKTKKFDFFAEQCEFTDDSVMSLAVAKALMDCKPDYTNLNEVTVRAMQKVGRPYPNCGYGGMFRQWMYSNNPQPYNSFGNGAAMRVSACGFAANTLEEAIFLSHKVTEVTHNHPEGMKGAEATAVCVFLARNGKNITEIRDYVNGHYYPMNFTLDGIRDSYQFNETCQDTVPQAIMAFLESTSFEDAIRNAISIGGDSDTLAAITGGIAEAYYGVPVEIRKHALSFLDDSLLNILTEFEKTYQNKTSEQKPKRSNRVATTNNNTASIGFEQQIWAAADILRGNMDAAEYKHVVLGLIFLKFISDKFEERYKELEADKDDVEDKDAYSEVNVFFVPPSARWNVISEAAHKENIGTVIDDAMRAIEKENKRLKDILPKNYARPELDKRRLGNVVDLFTNIQMVEHGTGKDILGRTYEYCLSKFAEQEGKRAGEFYTPSCVVQTLVEVLQPFEGRVYDPCCGSGGMFVQSYDFVKSHAGNRKTADLSVYGQDSNPTTRKMALMNLAIHGIEADLGPFNADTFHNDLHPTLKADFVMANPPFNLSDWNDGSLNDDPRWKYGLPPTGNANFAWLQHMIHHLAPDGKIGMVLANGSLSSQSGGEGNIRRKIVEDDLVEGIIAMPTQLFYTTAIPVSLWFINRNKKQKGKTLFIDARKMGTMVSRKLREMTYKNENGSNGDILTIAATFQAFHDGTLEDVKGFCATVSTEKIAEQDFILTPGRYVGIEEQEEDSEPFEEKMTRLTGELSVMFKRSHELEDEIRKRLGAIGFNI